MKKFKINGFTKQVIDEFFIDNEREIWYLILDAIEYCVSNNLDEKQVLELEPEVEKFFVFRSSFKDTLEKGITVFEKYEDYEQCARCKLIMNSL